MNDVQPLTPESEYQVPILVVDDTRDNLDLLEALLIGEGYQNVILVEDGESALEVLNQRGDIGLVLLDLMMPGMSGYEVCSRLSNNPATQDIPVIAVTGGGYVQNEALEKSFMAGAVDYIPKPINEVELFARVRVAIQLYLERSLRKLSVEKTVESEERFRTIFQEAPIGIAQLDKDYCIVTANRSFQALLGVGGGDLVGESIGRFMGHVNAALDSDEGYSSTRPEELMQGLLDRTGQSIEVVFEGAGSQPMWVNISLTPLLRSGSNGENNAYILIMENVTEKKLAADRMREVAYYDNLTGQANRALFQKEIARAVDHAKRVSSQFAVLFLDLDYFKNINDSLGHEVGDAMLKEVSRAIQGCIRETDLFARLGGDEFGLLLPRVSAPQDACAVARKILDRLQDPLQVDDHEFYAGVSIGISFYPQDGDSAQSLLRAADTAMYRAKELGRQNYQLFNPSMDRNVELRLDLEQDMRRGIKADEFDLFYQPQIATSSGKVVGLEALVRWRHPKRGLLEPRAFLELAEETGLILGLGDRLIEKAIAQTRSWLDEGLDPNLVVSVNLSLRQFQQHDLVRRISDYLEKYDLPAKHIGIEVTESINALDKDLVVSALSAFRNMGLFVALDDFGMGYSSLNHLRHFPLDCLKIDGSFVAEAEQGEDGVGILETIARLGKTLRLQVVAEGVETETQFQRVREIGCDAVQGYYFAHPLESAEVIDWVNTATLSGAAPD
ncbi:MAG: EAL domain-containing response regulator [Pseudomonadota bacterium]